jgi:ubiquinone/menaquinone biosynthesis C-methylase UbiE
VNTVTNRCPICNNSQLDFILTAKDYSVTAEAFQLLACSHCELGITTPAPQGPEIGRYYASENYISHSAKARNLTDQLYLFARKFTLRQKLSLIAGYHKKGKILDYGCGTGDFLNLALNQRWDAYGIEPAEQLAIKSNAKVFHSPEQLTVNNFDIITLWHVLEHVPNLNETLPRLRTKLKKGGTIFIAVPNHKSLDAKHYGSHWAGYDVPRHLWHFSRKAMTLLLEKNSFNLLEVKPMYLDAIYVSQLSEKYLSNNKSTITGMLKGTINGLKSNLAAFATREYSSLIYIARK